MPGGREGEGDVEGEEEGEAALVGESPTVLEPSGEKVAAKVAVALPLASTPVGVTVKVPVAAWEGAADAVERPRSQPEESEGEGDAVAARGVEVGVGAALAVPPTPPAVALAAVVGDKGAEGVGVCAAAREGLLESVAAAL